MSERRRSPASTSTPTQPQSPPPAQQKQPSKKVEEKPEVVEEVEGEEEVGEEATQASASGRRRRRQRASEDSGDIPIDELPSSLVLSPQLPDEFIGKVITAKLDRDRFGRTVVKMRVLITEPSDLRGSYAVITYPPSLLKYFKQASKTIGVAMLGDYEGLTIRFKRMSFDTGPFKANPRHYPVEIVKTSEGSEEEEGVGEE